jgi:hypothetical protein
MRFGGTRPRDYGLPAADRWRNNRLGSNERRGYTCGMHIAQILPHERLHQGGLIPVRRREEGVNQGIGTADGAGSSRK